MDKYNIVFKGYRRDSVAAGLPNYSGLYIVYRCIHNSEKKTVKLIEIIYIGQAEDIKERIKNHDKCKEFKNALKEGEELCYSYAEVKKSDLDIVENALVYSEKPRLNDNLKENFNHRNARFIFEGKTSLFKNTNFSIQG